MSETAHALAARWDAWLDQAAPQMEDHLIELLRYPTVEGEPAPAAPFGPVLGEALARCLEIGRELGFATENLDGYVGLIDWPGRQEEQVGVLSHLDVVPAQAADWQYPPFAGARTAERIYGRGAVDDKGPLVAALYAMAALRAVAPQPLKSIRQIIGCNEESGFRCMDYFLAHRTQPRCGFSPDGNFPLVVGEKGILHFSLEQRWQAAAADGLRLLRLAGGAATNVVPHQAKAWFAGDGAPLEACYAALPAAQQAALRLERADDLLVVTASGESAHASLPHLGKNAIMRLLRFLVRCEFAPAGARAFLTLLCTLYEDECAGASLGIAAADAQSALTASPNLLCLTETGGRLQTDVRFPVTHRLADYEAKLQALAARHGLQFSVDHQSAPLFVAEDQPIVANLLQVYREMTGDEAPPLVIGGGTYARVFENFVAFGPGLPGEPKLAHQADEYIARPKLLWLAKLYARALHRLAY